MNNEIIKRLLDSDPWTEFRSRVDLLDEPLDSPSVLAARKKMMSHPQINSLLTELNEWPGTVVNSHKSAGLLYHKLSFMVDIGFKQDDPKMNIIIEKIMEHRSPEGPFQLPMNIPVHFGGSGQDEYAWVLCDAPILVYCLAKLGLNNDSRVIQAKDLLIGLGSQNGYHCIGSTEVGKFRGPGKKDDPCPYATLIMLKLMDLYEKDRTSDHAKISIDSLLNLWEQSKIVHPYMFYMGTDFRKLKTPLIWYDILHFADTLSNFEYARSDDRFKEIVSVIEQKSDSNGFFTPESIWRAWKEWDFGQKKEVSAWMTFLVYRIKKRMEIH
jgi:hypothetical protein